MDSFMQSNFIYEDNFIYALKLKLGIVALRLFNLYIMLLDSNITKDNTVIFPMEIYDKIYSTSPSYIHADSIYNVIEELREMRIFDICEYISRMTDKSLYMTKEKKHIKITANNRDLPYIIAYKKRYLRHGLWNGLLLTTNNQLNFYELIKVYAQDRVVELSTKRIRQLLGVENYYSTKDVMRYIRSYNNVLKEKTDIHCILQKGRIAENKRILSMRFFIYDNLSFKPNKYLESIIHL